MSKFGGILKIGGIVAAVVAAGILIGWLGSKGNTPVRPLENPPTPQPTSGSSVAPILRTNPYAPPEIGRAPGRRPRNLAAVPAQPGSVLTNWEDRVDSILASEGEEAAKALEMLALFPQLPTDAQVEVAQHLSNLVADEDYAPLGALLANPSLAEDVLDVLMADVLNRPNAVKLPLLLEVARNGEHPKASEAKDLLELFLEEDYGTDWNQWQSSLQQWLLANPE